MNAATLKAAELARIFVQCHPERFATWASTRLEEVADGYWLPENAARFEIINTAQSIVVEMERLHGPDSGRTANIEPTEEASDTEFPPAERPEKAEFGDLRVSVSRHGVEVGVRADASFVYGGVAGADNVAALIAWLRNAAVWLAGQEAA